MKLTEHLRYEVEMTFYVASLLVNTQGTVLDPFARNAQIEAFTIHLRQLIDFFWKDRRPGERPRAEPDAFASDYFALGEWEKLRPERPAVLNAALREKVGWGVAHLTYGRARSTLQDKQWKPIDLSCALAPAVVCFAENVDPAKLEPRSVDAIKASAETFVNQFGALVL
jgi:hypothetical protein